MNIWLNDQPQTVPDRCTIAEALQALKINPQEIVIARNQDIIHRARWSSTCLNEGDKLDLFQLVVGG